VAALGRPGLFDDEGFLKFVDRCEDHLERDGEPYSTLQIENALRRHPAVADAAVLALPGGVGDGTVAVVVLRAPVPLDGLAKFCREWLDGHPVPSCFKVVERIPKTSSGRIRKVELRSQPGIFDDLYRVT
jgi:acyl-CoA synthetase (AMP-forming)/AMP-acid ligase II